MSVPDRLSAALSDRYRIERELGQGGMATVYLAHDLKHDRDVAIKVLKPELAAVLGADRFIVEIKTTAALQHPHILPLFDSGAADSFLFYVMPFIEGETLRAKLDRETQVGVDEAVKLTTDVADALHYAHSKGVIHRDIKPENILLANGRPMVADFGIALAVSAAAGGRMTETGLSLGTPHYMSPEQATAEKEITGRSDIYSLASVCYEMLAGQPPHLGGSAQQIIMKIIAEPVEQVTRYRKAVPHNVAAALSKALEKLPADRFESAAAFASALRDVHFHTAIGPVATAPALGRNRPALLFAGIAAVAAVVAAWTLMSNGKAPTDEPLARFGIATADAEALRAAPGRRLAFAPSGREFVYVGPGPRGGQLWIRTLGSLEATPIPGSEGATNPVFSPDGETIAFLTFGPFTIRTIPKAGGQARALTTDRVTGGGLDWGSDGFIYFDAGTELSRMRPDGTDRQSVVGIDSLEAIAWPTALPNGKAVLVRMRRAGQSAQEYGIEAVDVRAGTRKVLVRALVARYASGGYLLYVSADGALFAQRFDQDRLELSGAPLQLWNGLSVGTFGASDIAVSPSGDMLYAAGAATDIHRSVVWVTRSGTVAPVDSPAVDGLITSLALSPDESQIALGVAGATTGEDIWVKQLGGGAMTRVTQGNATNWGPAWAPGGRDLLFLSDRDGTVRLHRQRADGSGAASGVLGGVDFSSEFVLAPDGLTMVLRINHAQNNGDFFLFRIGSDSVPTPLMASPALERTPSVSPDGRWLAYASDESGRSEVYVRPFPSVDSSRTPVSTDGGASPRWSHAGNELFYQGADNTLMSAARRPGSAMSFSPPSRLFSLDPFWQWNSTARRWYDVSPDDQRFLMITTFGSARAADRMVYVANLFDDLARRFPR